MTIEVDRAALEDAIERRFPCPPEANRIEHRRIVVELADEIATLIEYDSWWDEFEA